MGILDRKENKNIKRQEKISEIVLSTKKQEALRVTGKKNDWGSPEKHIVYGTPFAIANFARAYPAKEKGRPVYAILGSSGSMRDGSPRYVHSVAPEGEENFFYADNIDFAIRPAFTLTPNLKSPNKVLNFFKKNEDTFIEYGYFPKTNANDEQNLQFETLFNNGQLKEGIKSLGIWYTTSGASEGRKKFTPRYVSVFEINGERWVRAIENPFKRDHERDSTRNNFTYPDGTVGGKKGSIRWFKDEPVTYKVLNPESSARRGYSLETEQAIIANIQFHNKRRSIGATNFKNSTIRAYFNGTKTQGGDFTMIGNFKSESFNPDREPITEWTIPGGQTDIADYAFQGACHLKKITIPDTVTTIGENAFQGTSLNFISKTKSGDIILSEESLPTPDILYSQDMTKFNQAFYGFDIGKVCSGDIALVTLEVLADKLSSTNDNLPYSFVENLIAHNELKAFVENSNLKGFRQLQKSIPINTKTEDLVDFYNFAYNIGCFSTNPTLNQRANKWLKEKVLPKHVRNASENGDSKIASKAVLPLLPFSSFHANFESWRPKGANEEFSSFLFSKSNKKNTTTFEEVQSSQGWGQFLRRIYDEFSNPEIDLAEGGRFRDKTSGKLMFAVFHNSTNAEGLDISKRKDLKPTLALFRQYFASKKFLGVKTADDKNIAEELSKWPGMQQKYFDRAQCIMDEFRAKKIEPNILGKHLKDITTEMEQYKKQTEELASRGIEAAKEIVGKLGYSISKEFTYDWLEKNDPKNFCLGLYCNCCANLAGVGYGIMRSNFVHPDIQNLVIKNKKGIPVAKSTLYINREQGYGVFNNVEVSHNMTDEQKQEIYKSYMEGVNDFAEEDNKQNSDKQLKKISVGMYRNDLSIQIKRGCSPSEILKGISFGKYGISGQQYDGNWNQGEQYLVWQQPKSADKKKAEWSNDEKSF